MPMAIEVFREHDALGFEFELGEMQVDFPLGKFAGGGEQCRIQGFFQGGEAVAGVGNDQQELQAAAGIGHRNQRAAGDFAVTIHVLFHQTGHLHFIRAIDEKRRVVLLVELLRPRCLHVDRVGQHEPGFLVDHARRDQILDAVVRLLFDPLVDVQARGFRGFDEIHLLKRRAVDLRGELQETVSQTDIPPGRRGGWPR